MKTAYPHVPSTTPVSFRETEQSGAFRQLSYNELCEMYPTEVVIDPVDQTEHIRAFEWDIPTWVFTLILAIFVLWALIAYQPTRDWFLDILWNAGLMDRFLEGKTESINSLVSALIMKGTL